jgi:hypothetical protein
MLNDKVMLVVKKPFRGIEVGEHITATFTPRAKMWNWSDGNNNSYFVSSREMKAHFAVTRRQVHKTCNCGRNNYQFDHSDYTCLPCIWDKNNVKH